MPLPVFDVIEYVCIMIFTVEYLCRLLTVHVMVVPTVLLQPDDRLQRTLSTALTRVKTYAYLRPIFNRFDADQDGVISVEEMLAMGTGIFEGITLTLTPIPNPKPNHNP